MGTKGSILYNKGLAPNDTHIICVSSCDVSSFTPGYCYAVFDDGHIIDDRGDKFHLSGLNISTFSVHSTPKEPAVDKISRQAVLDTASNLINGDRASDYGDAEDMHQLIANLWSDYLNHLPATDDGIVCIEPDQVAMMMVLMKVARSTASPKFDTYVDIAGYAALGSEMTKS